MKKKIKIGLVLAISVIAIVALVFYCFNVIWPTRIKINEAYFPDAFFREYVRLNFDTDQDGVLSIEERKQVKEIDLLDQKPLICSLKGIEYFEELDMRHNPKVVYAQMMYDKYTIYHHQK